jgi:hypothetical protein
MTFTFHMCVPYDKTYWYLKFWHLDFDLEFWRWRPPLQFALNWGICVSQHILFFIFMIFFASWEKKLLYLLFIISGGKIFKICWSCSMVTFTNLTAPFHCKRRGRKSVFNKHIFFHNRHCTCRWRWCLDRNNSVWNKMPWWNKGEYGGEGGGGLVYKPSTEWP